MVYNYAMTSLRLFIAIDFSSGTIRKISTLELELQERLSACPIRWVSPINLHLTLQFLGETNQGKIPVIIQALDSTAAVFDPFNVQLFSLGCFPSLKKPEVIWLGLNQEKALFNLAETLSAHLKPLGFSTNGKFLPHLTLGRVNKNAGESEQKLIGEVLKAHQDVEIGQDEVEQIILYKSTLTPRCPIYTPLHCSKL